jgi:CubicO group peptidase (beta-lactamase class C family)
MRYASSVNAVAIAAALSWLATGSALQAQEAVPGGFLEASPESQGIAPEALESLADVVQGYVNRGLAVGGELVVIKNRHSVLHETFGWRDREAEVPMERNTLFNIRSMTKPLTGAAAQILIDEGKLALDDRAAEYIPGFDTDSSRNITVEQLLTHRSGLPLTILASVDQYETLFDMANAAGERGPQFEPGSKFWYSDTGTDVLGAIVEQVSGMTLDAFVTRRLLEPLGMVDALYLMDLADPRAARVATLYGGTANNWNRFWGPDNEPFYPFAWGSQTLYSSPLSYARFLAMWLDGGMAGDDRILSPDAISRTLTPVARMGQLGSDAPYPTLYPGLTVYHGQMAVLHVEGDPVDGAPPPGVAPMIYGYSGSDGTIAWAWPEHDLIILYFTQSRGGASVIRLEAEIERLVLNPPAGAGVEMPAEYGDYLGPYVANFGPFRNERFEILWRDGGLALDIPSQLVFGLDGPDEQQRWNLREVQGAAVSFVRGEDGEVTGLQIHQGGMTFDLPKGEPEPEEETPLSLEEVEMYLGWFRDEETSREVEVVLQNGRLALRIPETPEPLELYPPDDQGAWRLRMNPGIVIRFTEEDGKVVSYSATGPGGQATFGRIDRTEP